MKDEKSAVVTIEDFKDFKGLKGLKATAGLFLIGLVLLLISMAGGWISYTTGAPSTHTDSYLDLYWSIFTGFGGFLVAIVAGVVAAIFLICSFGAALLTLINIGGEESFQSRMHN